MPLTAIVPVHNEAAVLTEVLQGVARQSLKPDELILVLDACTDGSEVIARRFPAKLLRVDVRNTATAILAGVSDASNEILVLFDGNTIVPSNYVQTLVEESDRTDADLVEWHGGMMLLSKSTLHRFGPFSSLHLWTLEYFLRVEAKGGKVVRLDGPHKRLKRSPLRRNLRYGLDYAELSARYPIAPFFRIGTKSGWLPDFVAFGGAVFGHLLRHRIREALRDLSRALHASDSVLLNRKRL